ncbi:MAG TPA: alpha/beta fold hydrolase [Pyrinomonadaceae bacterium]|nr:alpha/beta fold hydrolase [Pyrinomonadaceae bacterium]
MDTETKVTERPTVERPARSDAHVRSVQPHAQASFLSEIELKLKTKPFRPHPSFTGGHAQTFAAYYWPRGFLKRAHRRDEPRIFEVEPGVRLLAHCRWQKERLERPVLILVHGLEGSNTSVYMLGTAVKAFAAGFNVVRLNLRTCGKTEHLTPTLYHGGLTSDLLFVIRELVERDRLSQIFLTGFSLGGNMSMMMPGEDPERVPRELKGICAISPTIELGPCSDAIERRENWHYKWSFMRSMRNRVRRKRKFFPDLYDTRGLRRIRTLRDFDARYVVADGGYRSVDDYYERASSLRVLSHIRTPTLIIHAQDDPLVPFDPFRDPSIQENPYIIFLATERGGHVGFVGAKTPGEDRFWVENRAVEFCKLLHEHSTP